VCAQLLCKSCARRGVHHSERATLHVVCRGCCSCKNSNAGVFSPFFLSLLQEANDDLDSALLDQTVEDSIKSEFACQTIDSILDFYLKTILPKAAAGYPDDTANLKPHVLSIQEIFDQLRTDVTQCRNYFSCKKHFEIRNLTSAYNEVNVETNIQNFTKKLCACFCRSFEVNFVLADAE
uniref:Interleukin family protein n=1 Tax=Oryzias sinensis TaxID=183150 RepID=A0A8C7X5T6_9TELE